MKSLFYILLAVLPWLVACERAQGSVEFDPIVSKAKETSLYAASIDWDEINKKFVELRSSGELEAALEFLLNSLGDKHGTFRSSKDFSIVANFTGEQMEPDTRDPKFVDEVINDTSARFSYRLLDRGIGYLKVVGIGPGDVKTQADAIRQGLNDLNGQEVDKWILDLRFNGGGNMEPMLAGLAPLLGNGIVGGAVKGEREITREYHIENGLFFNSGRLVCRMENVPSDVSGEKVAVLTSRYTASSGELVGVSFKGRANTRFIGESTAGYTTGNGFDRIGEDLVMVISQDLFMDRNGVRYDQRVGVDEEIEFQHDVAMEDDPQIGAAIRWLVE